MIDDDSSVVRLLEESEGDSKVSPGRASVRIGQEAIPEDESTEPVRDLSIVTAPYYRSNMRGTIGVIGPTRMDYARVIALVEGIALLMSWPSPGAFGTHRA